MVLKKTPLPMNIQELTKMLGLGGQKYSDNDLKLIWLAYNFARSAHADQKRESGELYIYHPLAVATILAGIGFDAETLSAALLHDVIEDTSVTVEEIQAQFGEKIALLVDGVTKLSKYDAPDKSQRDASALRKLFIAMISDARVILIKLADRLHNLQTLSALSLERQQAIAKETLEIYAPIAERLGIWTIKSALEDIAFRNLEPAIYNEISAGIERGREEHEIILGRIIDTLTEKMVKAGIPEHSVDISGRRKHIYSIYRKMLTPKYEGQGIERIYDKLGIRVIVNTVQECYVVLGLIHSEWSPIPGEFDDYIGMRLPSGYQSLHTSVKYGPAKNDIVEFQIRTYQMHWDAEYGIAAHWLYKERENSRRDVALEQKVSWLRQMLEDPQSDDPESFVAILKTDVLQDRVYTFTPKGDIIDLPVGSTAIDFAYSVHTDVGHRCRGAKVNGKLVSLEYELKTGDQVEILTTRHGGPSRDWLNPNLGLVKTQRARSKIRHWFKRQAREKNNLQGKGLLDKELRRLGMVEVNLERLAREFDYRNLEDFFVAVGNGDLPLARIVKHLTLGDKEEEVAELVASTKSSQAPDSDPVSVLGLKGLLTTFARCCNPAPGDAIVGYITRGRGATIHRQDCPNVLRVEDHERLVRVSWGEPKSTYPVPVRIKAYDRNGLMKDVSTLISDEGINMPKVKVETNHNLAVFELVLEVRDIVQLSRVLDRLENLPNVMEAQRVRPG